MSHQSEREEDQAFNSLSPEEQKRYREAYDVNGGNPKDALDRVIGPRWFNEDGTPRGTRFGRNPKR